VRKPDLSCIELEYHDALGQKHEVSEETRSAILQSMGEPERGPDPILIIRAGERKKLRGAGEIFLEDGTRLAVKSTLPAKLPLGYHRLQYDKGGEPIRLIVAPKTCYLPEDLRIWGWSVQLYALRSSSSWGIGDLSDLRRFAEWSAHDLGARILLLNPLCSASPILPQQPSPYYPSSRRFRNLLYLRIEEIAGATDLGEDLERLAQAAVALNHERRIDRDAVYRLKMNALDRLWLRFKGDPAFDAFCKEQGDSLLQFATFSALAEHHGSGWHTWPDEYRRPEAPEVKRFAEARQDRIRFHQWVQWLLDEQLARAANDISLMQDLPIGVDPDGADAWAWQDFFAAGAGVGAPPDEYNTQGQDWGIPPFIPWKLRRGGYEPFIQTIRGALRHAGGLRIDHVMGLFRLFWIPQGADARSGAYVHYPADDLLAIVALESQRAKGYIVGEDLGTVEDNVRQRLAEHSVLSYRLVWFEWEPPAAFPKRALAAITTHDLPTVAGLWTGSDLKVQLDLGLKPNEEGTVKMRERIRDMAGLSNDASVTAAVKQTHEMLAKAPSMIVTATTDDAAGVEERPNIPGTTGDEWPSWSMALPQSLEDFEKNDLALTIARTLAAGR
jgi:4-alpha-glucanotransferase